MRKVAVVTIVVSSWAVMSIASPLGATVRQDPNVLTLEGAVSLTSFVSADLQTFPLFEDGNAAVPDRFVGYDTIEIGRLTVNAPVSEFAAAIDMYGVPPTFTIYNPFSVEYAINSQVTDFVLARFELDPRSDSSDEVIEVGVAGQVPGLPTFGPGFVPPPFVGFSDITALNRDGGVDRTIFLQANQDRTATEFGNPNLVFTIQTERYFTVGFAGPRPAPVAVYKSGSIQGDPMGAWVKQTAVVGAPPTLRNVSDILDFIATPEGQAILQSYLLGSDGSGVAPATTQTPATAQAPATPSPTTEQDANQAPASPQATQAPTQAADESSGSGLPVGLLLVLALVLALATGVWWFRRQGLSRSEKAIETQRETLLLWALSMPQRLLPEPNKVWMVTKAGVVQVPVGELRERMKAAGLVPWLAVADGEPKEDGVQDYTIRGFAEPGVLALGTATLMQARTQGGRYALVEGVADRGYALTDVLPLSSGDIRQARTQGGSYDFRISRTGRFVHYTSEERAYELRDGRSESSPELPDRSSMFAARAQDAPLPYSPSDAEDFWLRNRPVHINRLAGPGDVGVVGNLATITPLTETGLETPEGLAWPVWVSDDEQVLILVEEPKPILEQLKEQLAEDATADDTGPIRFE